MDNKQPVTGRQIKTLKIRVKDKHASLLCQMAGDVNTVWNFCNETSQKAIRDRHQFLTGYDLQKLVRGYVALDGVHIQSSTAYTVCVVYASRRQKARKARLRWRVSDQRRANRSFGWVPFSGRDVIYRGGQIKFAGHMFSLWDSYGLGQYKLRAGSFSQDARGRWYFNVAVEVETQPSAGKQAVGIDLGLKTAVTVSDGQRLEGRLFRAAEDRLGMAQRAGKKRLARTIHAKVRNQRRDALHKFSTALVRQSGAIFVGNVSPSTLLKTTMAKSTQDAGWAMFKTMLEYKCHQAGVIYQEVNEAYTTQTCNECGVIAGPKGRAGLNKRSWQCGCGAVHDRDVNAALNIRARGLASLEEGAEA